MRGNKNVCRVKLLGILIGYRYQGDTEQKNKIIIISADDTNISYFAMEIVTNVVIVYSVVVPGNVIIHFHSLGTLKCLQSLHESGAYTLEPCMGFVASCLINH